VYVVWVLDSVYVKADHFAAGVWEWLQYTTVFALNSSMCRYLISFETWNRGPYFHFTCVGAAMALSHLQAKLLLVGGYVSLHAGTVAPQYVVGEEPCLGRVAGGKVLSVPSPVSIPLLLVVCKCVIIHPLRTKMRRLLPASVGLERSHILLISLRGWFDIK